MGAILNATCPCGFEHKIYAGAGMRDFKTRCDFPHYCKTCNTIISINLMKLLEECPNCTTNKFISYMDDSMIGQNGRHKVFTWNTFNLSLHDGNYLCPKCEEYQLTFKNIGCFD